MTDEEKQIQDTLNGASPSLVAQFVDMAHKRSGKPQRPNEAAKGIIDKVCKSAQSARITLCKERTSIEQNDQVPLFAYEESGGCRVIYLSAESAVRFNAKTNTFFAIGPAIDTSPIEAIKYNPEIWMFEPDAAQTITKFLIDDLTKKLAQFGQ